MGSVVMHNLRRVAAGLRGEYLEPEKTPEPEDNDENTNSASKKINKKGGRKRKEAPVVADEDWQDIAVYEQEEGMIEVGEVGPRIAIVQDGGEEPEVQITGGTSEQTAKKLKKGDEAGQGDGKLDKAARKKAKKERDQQRKKENEKKRAQKA